MYIDNLSTWNQLTKFPEVAYSWRLRSFRIWCRMHWYILIFEVIEFIAHIDISYCITIPKKYFFFIFQFYTVTANVCTDQDWMLRRRVVDMVCNTGNPHWSATKWPVNFSYLIWRRVVRCVCTVWHIHMPKFILASCEIYDCYIFDGFVRGSYECSTCYCAVKLFF